MDAHEIRQNGTLLRYHQEYDGSWYVYKIWYYKLGNKFYSITDHEGLDFNCSNSYFGRVKEIAAADAPPKSTVTCAILGINSYGQIRILEQGQGIPEAMTFWASKTADKYRNDYRYREYRIEYVFYPMP